MPDTSSRPTLLGAPFDAHSSYVRGAALGPAAIRDALGSSATNMWTESGIDLSTKLGDAGDAPSQETLTAAVTSLIARGDVPIMLGGDHSITYQILQAIRPHYPSLTLLQIDAHPDLYDQFDGDPLSHACQFARIMEAQLADRLIQVGIRTMNRVQSLQRDRFGVECIDMRSFASGSRPVIDGALYISIDLDGMDPAFAPGVAHREPGGLSSRDVITLIQSSGGSLIGADVVELNPPRDADGITAPLAAKLVKELAGRMLSERAKEC
jgi:arginase